MRWRRPNFQVINTLDVLDAHAAVLRLLPPLPTLSDEAYRALVEDAEEARERDLLVLFAASSATLDEAQSGDLKKLPAALETDGVDFRLVDCSTLDDRCSSANIGALPRLVFFRRNGNFIVHYGESAAAAKSNLKLLCGVLEQKIN